MAASLCLLQTPPGAFALEFRHSPVKAAPGHQLPWGPLLGYHLSLFHHHGVARLRHGPHPVGDDQHRLAGQQPGESLLDSGFIFHVQRGGGLNFSLTLLSQTRKRSVRRSYSSEKETFVKSDLSENAPWQNRHPEVAGSCIALWCAAYTLSPPCSCTTL